MSIGLLFSSPIIPSNLFYIRKGIYIDGIPLNKLPTKVDTFGKCLALCRENQFCSHVAYNSASTDCMQYGGCPYRNKKSGNQIGVKRIIGFNKYDGVGVGPAVKKIGESERAGPMSCLNACLWNSDCDIFHHNKDNGRCSLFKGVKSKNLTTAFKRGCRWYDLWRNSCSCWRQ